MNGQDREQQAIAHANQQARAARLVDDHATDPQDRAMLIAMLGLEGGVAVARAPHVGPLN